MEAFHGPGNQDLRLRQIVQSSIVACQYDTLRPRTRSAPIHDDSEGGGAVPEMTGPLDAP